MPFLSVNGMKIHYKWEGKVGGRELVFLHGWSGSIQWWRRQIPELSKDYRMLLIDLPGHGYSSGLFPHTSEVSIRFLSDVLYSILTMLNVKDHMIVGWSLGGMVTLQYLFDHPKNLSALILVDTSPIGRIMPSFGFLPKIPYHWIPDPRRILFLVKLWEHVVEVILSFIYMLPIRRGVAAFLVNLLAAGKKPKKRLIAWATEVLLENLNIKALFQITIGTLFFNVIDKLKEIDVPTLIIHGSEDRIISTQYPELLKQNIKGSILKIIEGSGHCPHLEKPKEFNYVVSEFLNKVLK